MRPGDREMGQGFSPWLYVHIISKDFTMVLVGRSGTMVEEKGMWGGGGISSGSRYVH